MQLDFDETEWPDLTAFRKACLASDLSTMRSIAAKQHDWYELENPKGIEQEKLAKVFQAQYHAACGNLDELKALVESDPWVVSYPWTAQQWLPISQAASAAHRPVIEFLLDKGADPCAMVGDPKERTSIPDLARYGGHNELAEWLDRVIETRGGDS